MQMMLAVFHVPEESVGDDADAVPDLVVDRLGLRPRHSGGCSSHVRPRFAHARTPPRGITGAPTSPPTPEDTTAC